MAKYLTHSEAEYREAARFARLYLESLKDGAPERKFIEIFFETASFAALRMENPPLKRVHLEKMHGQPVYCSSWGGGPTGGGIIDANKELVYLLDGAGGRISAEPWFDFGGSVGKYYSFPLNDVDLLKAEQGKSDSAVGFEPAPAPGRAV